MRVLFISHQANQSGAPNALLHELKMLRYYHKEIQPVILLLEGGVLVQEFKKLFPTIGWYNIFLKAIFKLRLERLFLKFLPIDCIYGNSIVSVDIGLYLKRRLNVPFILHVHESESYLKNYAKSANYLQNVDSYITVSELCKRCLEQKYDVASDKIVIQHPFSPLVVKFMENDREEIPVDKKKDELIIGTICNGSWPKAPELIALIANIFFVKHPHVNCKFMVVGIDKESQAHYYIAYDLEKMQLQDKVILAGRVEQPLYIYSKFDILFLHSREESFSLVAEEAACMGLPIVGFQGATGAAEWITDECGILVPYLDLNAAADALFKLCCDEQLRIKLGNKGNSTIRRMYAEESQMKNVANALYSIV
jgi:glycosyltransferase involved in cell wall biosynthesis